MERIDLDINWQEREDTDYCVTELLKYVNDPFNRTEMAQKIYEKWSSNAASKYYKMTPEQIIKAWDEKRQRSQYIGHALDDYTGVITEPQRMLEHHQMTEHSWMLQYGNDPVIMTITSAWELYWKHLEEIGWKMVKREQHMRTEVNGKTVRGRADMILYYPPKDAILIIDWKTSEEMNVKRKKNFPLHGPSWCSAYSQEKLVNYGLQANTYRHIITPLMNKPYNIATAIIQIDRRGDVNVYPDPMPYHADEMQELLEWCVKQKIEYPDLHKDE